MNCIDRKVDVIENKPTPLEHLYTFKDFPVFMGCVNQPKEQDINVDMSWWISPSTGVIQLNPLLPLDVVYAEEHGSGTVGGMWNEHHQAFADFIMDYDVSYVLEIGGLHGHLAQKCLQHNPKLDWTIVEPNPCVDESINVKIVKGFFDNNFNTGTKYDAVVHSHVLEHLYNPHEFMKHKSSFMHNGSLLFISIPNMEVMLERKYNNCLNFEHTYYLNDEYVTHLLKSYGFALLSKKHYKDDHSVFYCARKIEVNLDNTKTPQLYKSNKKIYNNYIDYHVNLITELNNSINGKTNVYLFGGHIFSQYLIAFGLNTNCIVGILDNDKRKQGKRLYGTDFIVQSPDILKEKQDAIVILKAGVYNNEIKAQINSINSNVVFI
jgi:hypothetical protein